MVINSIWCDTFYVKYIIEDYLDFRIELDDAIIYRGRAYRYPDSDSVRININKICQNYLDSSISSLIDKLATGEEVKDSDRVILNSILTFKLYEGDSTVFSDSWTFINNWSYVDKAFDDYSESDVSMDMNEIINGHYAMGMRLLDTRYEKTFNYSEQTSEGTEDVTLHNKLVITVDDTPLYTVPSCGDYAIYYQNIKGGWNSFLIEGSVVKKENYTNHGYCKSFNNTTVEFDEKTYNSEVFTNYSCVTGWLTDKESETFVRNIGNCTAMYLHNLKEDKIFPVLITDNNFTYKTYQNQGKKLVNYTFNLKASQCKIRL